jgi:hypothetical protein
MGGLPQSSRISGVSTEHVVGEAKQATESVTTDRYRPTTASEFRGTAIGVPAPRAGLVHDRPVGSAGSGRMRGTGTAKRPRF